MDQGPDAPQGQSIDSIRQSSGTLGPMVIHENYEDGANHKVYSSPSVHPILQEAPNHSCPVAVSINPTTSLTRGDNMIEAFGEVSSTPSVPPILSDSNPDSSQGSSFLAKLQNMIDAKSNHRIVRPPPDPSVFEELQAEELKSYQKKLTTMTELERKCLEATWQASRRNEAAGRYYENKLVEVPRALFYEKLEKVKEEEDETEKATRYLRLQRNDARIKQLNRANATGHYYNDRRFDDVCKRKK